jgi:hypothetical protein
MPGELPWMGSALGAFLYTAQKDRGNIVFAGEVKTALIPWHLAHDSGFVQQTRGRRIHGRKTSVRQLLMLGSQNSLRQGNPVDGDRAV